MIKINPEFEEANLEQLSMALVAWEQSAQIGNKLTESFRDLEYKFAIELTESLIYSVRPRRMDQLKIGQTALDASSYDAASKGIYKHPVTEISPSSTFDLFNTISFVKPEEKQRDLYVGNGLYLELGRVAFTLADGGELSIVKAPIQN